MSKWKKKPVVIEAIQWRGNNTKEIEVFVGESLKRKAYVEYDRTAIAILMIPTLESPHEAKINDWIIKGVKGEFYPCKPDIFKATYDEVCESCNEVKELGDYNGKRYCNHCVNAEESGEKANN